MRHQVTMRATRVKYRSRLHWRRREQRGPQVGSLLLWVLRTAAMPTVNKTSVRNPEVRNGSRRCPRQMNPTCLISMDDMQNQPRREFKSLNLKMSRTQRLQVGFKSLSSISYPRHAREHLHNYQHPPLLPQ